MKIFVCIKQVPDTETKIKIKSDGMGIEPTGIKWVMNPYDEYAVEESIKIRDANPGSTINVVTVGQKERAVEALRTALAMGADEGLVIHTSEALDAYSTAKALSSVIQSEGGADLVLTGKLSIDANQSSVSQMVAEFLKIPHATVVSKLQITSGSLSADRDIEGGAKEKLQLSLPALVAANKGLNTPRYASLPGIMKAKKKIIKEFDAVALGLADTDKKVILKNFSLPPDKPAVKILSGDVAAQSQELIKLLRDEAKAL
jgi:electron transfer flavoprotein beta subunit